MKTMPEAPEWLNYHHLRHFWMIARSGGVTRAARILRTSQSTLSEQLGELEAWLGQKLFERRGRTLALTEAGRLAWQHADSIFTTGQELLARLRQAEGPAPRVLRLGAVGPLSKNLQFDFIQPLLAESGTRLVVVAGPLADLARQLQEHELDLVLSNVPLRSDQQKNVYNHFLGEVPVYFVGSHPPQSRRWRFPQYLRDQPLFLPSYQSSVRTDFELLLREAEFPLDIRAEVDDMALLRLLALSGQGWALVSKIVVERDLGSRKIGFVRRVPGLVEKYFALTARQRFDNAWMAGIVKAFRARLRELASAQVGRRPPGAPRPEGSAARGAPAGRRLPGNADRPAPGGYA